ncbi:acetyltransferase [Wolinella succinogenes]|uniref:acetyltransferase n=1 Tax=Wolinella succinogenes TaxID=844 RepID=UPI002FCA7EAF
MKIALYGASGHGKVVGEIAQLLGYEIIALVDDAKEPKELFNLRSIPSQTFFECFPETPVALGIGDNSTRAKIFTILKEKGYNLPILIHPHATVSRESIWGEGSVAMAGVIVNASTSIGEGVILNSGVVVEHDNEIGSFAHLSPRVACAGGVRVGRLSHLGIGACVIQNLTIGESCVIGAGSVVINDIESFKKVVGNPAKRELS